MANTQDSFTIDVNINGGNTSPTSPSRRKSQQPGNPFTLSGFLKNSGMKNYAAIAAVGATAISVGKTYIDIQFSRAENTHKANRFNFTLRAAGWGASIAGGAAMGGPIGAGVATVAVIADAVKAQMQYNNKLFKMNKKYDYIVSKNRENTANNSYWNGGTL